MQLTPSPQPANPATPPQPMSPPSQHEPVDSDGTAPWVSSPEQHSPPDNNNSSTPCRSVDSIPPAPPAAPARSATFASTALKLASTSQHLHPGSFPIKKKRLTDSQRIKTISDALSTILDCLDDDPSREGLRKTPVRFAKALLSLTEGYRKSPAEVLGDAEFDEGHSEMVIVRNIDVFSLCEHHLLPFHGICHVSYIPSGSIIGLSKVARIIDVYAKRFQVQERLTTQIADAIQSATNAAGVFVYISCSHMCMAMRGVQKVGTQTSTTAARGRYARESQLRTEALSIFLGPHNHRVS